MVENTYCRFSYFFTPQLGNPPLEGQIGMAEIPTFLKTGNF
jgi:hypothetical protein